MSAVIVQTTQAASVVASGYRSKQTHPMSLKAFPAPPTSDDVEHPHTYEYNGVTYNSYLHGELHNSTPVATKRSVLASPVSSFRMTSSPTRRMTYSASAPVVTAASITAMPAMTTTAAPIRQASVTPKPAVTTTTATPVRITSGVPVTTATTTPIRMTSGVVSYGAPAYSAVAPVVSAAVYHPPSVSTVAPTYHSISVAPAATLVSTARPTGPITTALHGPETTAVAHVHVSTQQAGDVPAFMLSKETNEKAQQIFSNPMKSPDPHHPHIYEFNGVKYSSFMHGEFHHSTPVSPAAPTRLTSGVMPYGAAMPVMTGPISSTVYACAPVIKQC